MEKGICQSPMLVSFLSCTVSDAYRIYVWVECISLTLMWQEHDCRPSQYLFGAQDNNFLVIEDSVIPTIQFCCKSNSRKLATTIVEILRGRIEKSMSSGQ